MTVADLISQGSEGDGPFGDHLARLREYLRADPMLEEAVRAVLEGQESPEAAFFPLRSAGILSGPSGKEARTRCRLYAEYLRRILRPPA